MIIIVIIRCHSAEVAMANSEMQEENKKYVGKNNAE
jgi:hypothetical protein